MPITICIFEDELCENFFPLTYTRPVYELRYGIFSLQQKIQNYFSRHTINYHTRPLLQEVLQERFGKEKVNSIIGDECLFINGRVIFNEQLFQQISLKKKEDVVYISENTIVAAKVSEKKLESLKKNLHEPLSLKNFDGMKQQKVEAKFLRYPWDIIPNIGKSICEDFTVIKKSFSKKKNYKVYDGVIQLNKKNILIGEGSIIKPSVVLDAEEGPIVIGKNVTIMSNSTIVGPVYIGDNSIIKIGSKIYHDTSIGPVCKIGGEAEASVFHSYSNKQHDGFVGHSYIGSWCNLGAGTTTSDLKNNYSTVKVMLNKKTIDTHSQFVGTIMGDHSKTAINTSLNTGTIVGVSCNIFSAGFPQKYLPSFSWGGAENSLTSYNYEQALDVAKKVMLRRKIEMTQTEEKLFHTIFELTKNERQNF